VIGSRDVDGFEALTLSSEDGELQAAFVPEAGIVGCSLRHRGEELLGQRGGLARYVAERSTMGIPLLYPWANRVASRRFRVAGGEVNLDLASPPPSLDPNGLPIHGLLAAAEGWQVERHEARGDGGLLVARFEFGAQPGLIAAFPFPHEVTIEAKLEGMTLTIATTVEASGDTEVPISFGYHPYFLLPGVERADWEIEVPVRERLVLDDEELPTGKREPAGVDGGRLGSRTFDDEFVAPEGSAPLALAGGARRIEVALLSGYPYTQVYAPADDDVIAFEPMTAPTDALIAGGAELPLVAPGESYRAIFAIAVEADG
jgi:galactose mutarotase-like enzyme